MKLTELSYKTANWEIKNLEFDNVSLIVGKNSTGKSKTLRAIDLLGKILTQRVGLVEESTWNVTFSSDKYGTINYQFIVETSNGESFVSFEQMAVDDKVYVHRKLQQASLQNVLDNIGNTIYPPSNKLTIHITRDIKKYPYLEEIIIWAERSYGFKFGSIGPEVPYNQQEYNLLTAVDEIPALYKELSAESKERVRKYFLEIGYRIDEIVFTSGRQRNFLHIKESDMEIYLAHYQLSQGMFRSLSILIFIEYLLFIKKAATVIIDDLCEGLDYDRATKLGKIIYENCIQKNIQLIATSNDMFLMDVVNLKYWNLLQRDGAVVTALNPKNQPDLFNDFQFTGLSNFDFLASDYIAQKIKK
ncbi:AAA domain-containing protein, putative AbiEii toxin, Type IV TA system [Chitinophaga sp. CF118]|uniref:ATP-binding protein n=1 Tax=Chitinophaga sp. CF118 TaxID=1884367 RepID=UPI0008EF4685|nr:ATP-binding protein [Chitinophaga sp. CF118]SFE92140.1 AAA domain-containing protein, putative AbiEii toxin, Type IV TA system [Chitinophaga sp. CF118]